MKVIQVKLKYNNSEIITWVDYDKRIKEGVKLSLRDDKEKYYEVIEVYGIIDSSSLHTDWNVGGLEKT